MLSVISSRIEIGERVRIVLKKDQRTGNLTEGIVKDILTKSDYHPHGIKVRLESGDVGRVKEILDLDCFWFIEDFLK
ncbi:YwbE family protein [Halobacteriovorax sp. ZH4_bin.1]|uniref:YwbE family protein n=1 Tax=unclassified Halobacteriovorax TaxID=2639665 RepID=UPI00371BE5C0